MIRIMMIYYRQDRGIGAGWVNRASTIEYRLKTALCASLAIRNAIVRNVGHQGNLKLMLQI
jgi:hypothetical protein